MEGQQLNSIAKDPIAETLRSYAQNILVVIFGLLPIFFIPSSLAPFEYAKILLVTVGVLSAFVLYSLSALRAGGVTIGISYTIIGAWTVALVAFVSALLSGDFRDSMLGDTMTTHTTGFLILLALIMSVWTLIGSGKRSVMRLYMLIAASTIVLVLYHIVRLLFGADTLSFGIFTSSVSTPMGAWNDLALFLGLSVILSLVALDQLPLTRSGRWLFVAVALLALIMLSVINFFTVWIVLGITSLAIVVYALTKDRFSGSQLQLVSTKAFNTTSLVVSLVVFVASTLFIIGGSSLGAVISERTGVTYVEVRPSLQATADIARNVYNENAFLGIGPNKFIDAWRLYKDQSINTTTFWNTDFVAGNGYVTTFFITMGVLGIVAWVFFLGAFLFSGVRMLMSGNDQDRMWYFIGLSSFIGGLYIWGMSIVYVPGAVMLMLGALCVGVTVTAERALSGRSGMPLSLITNRRTGFIFTLAVIAIIISSVGGLYVIGKHYAAVQEGNSGIKAFREEGSAAAQAHLERAYTLYASDTYARQISELQFTRMNSLLSVQNRTEAEQLELQQVIKNTLTAAEQATRDDALEPNNWTLLGNTYSVLMGSNFEGVYDRAKQAFTRARELNPKNPIVALNLAVLEGRAGNYDAARTLAQEAIALRPDFTDAFYYLSQLDIATGNVEGAIRATISTISFQPNNQALYFQLGVLEAARSNADNAILAFERAVALDENYANARYLLAIAYDEKNRPEDALRELKKVLELNPGNQDVQSLINTLESGGRIVNAKASIPTVPSVSDAGSVTAENGTVTTETAPGTTLVSPVNTVPESTTDKKAATP